MKRKCCGCALDGARSSALIAGDTIPEVPMLSPVPMFTRSLTALEACLAKAEAHCEARRIKPEVLAADRLFPDMFPLSRQVQIATDHAKGAPFRLAGLEVPVFEDTEVTLADLRGRCVRAREVIAGIGDAAFEGAEERTIVLKVAGREMTFAGTDYLMGWAIPNFFFHMTTAYNILRKDGVEVGKRDFLG
jgi:hypothetical protein